MGFCGIQASHAATITLIDGTFANGNGSFVYDSTGTALTGATVINGLGKWVTTGGTLTYANAATTLTGSSGTKAQNGFATADTHSLNIQAKPAPGANDGAAMMLSHTVSLTDLFTLSYDFGLVIKGAGAGAHTFAVTLFTSSDNSLTGTLTALGQEVNGGNTENGIDGSKTLSTASGDFIVDPANVGQNLWISIGMVENG